jgi:hydroxyacylglutathione hydrolase
MNVVPLKAFRDNYIWLLSRGPDAAVVDPGGAAPVLDHLGREGLRLSAILLTHHHADHVGGVGELVTRTGARVFGPADDGIAGIDVPLAEPARLRLPGLDLELAVLDVPGHTRGHIAYYGAGLLFCGDTLFGCGCGRLFEGTAAQMWQSLCKLAALPPDTRVYCAHEYTQANLDFAFAVEPDNPSLREREARVAELRASHLPSVPSTIAEEHATNPFLRAGEPAPAQAASRFLGRRVSDAVEVFAALREWKNGF